MRFHLIDRIVEVVPGKRLRAVKNLTLGEEYLADHFPSFPVMPGVMMLQTLIEAGAWLLRLSEDYRHSIIVLREVKNIKYGSKAYTDDAIGYDKVSYNFVHDVVNHAERYVNGRVHTNGLENFWSLLKRGISGTYVSVEPFHLFRYLDEQMFRFNNRKDLDDAGRFVLTVSQILGKRLTFAELTGKVGTTTIH